MALTWANVSCEILLRILRTSDLLAVGARVCQQWRFATTLVQSEECNKLATDAQVRGLCAAAPFLRTLQVDGEARVSDKGAEAVLLLTELQTFTLQSWGSSGERTLFALSALPQLTALDFSWCAALSDHAVRNLARSGNLRLKSLTLRGCRRIGDLPIAGVLRVASGLTHLDMSFCHNVGNTAVRTLAGLTALQTLQMRSLQKVTSQSAAVLGSLTSLTSLDVSYCCEISGYGASTWTALRSLRTAALAGCSGISPYWVGRFLLCWSNLETLDLFNNPQLSDVGVAFSLPRLTRLRALDISHNPLLSSQSISRLGSLTALTDLSASGLHGVQSDAFASILNLTRLKSLGLHCNAALPDEVLSALTQKLTSLTQLGLRHCCMHRAEHRSPSATDLFAGLRSSMRHLDLSFSKLGSAPHFSQLDALESLHLCGCDVTDETMSRISGLPRLLSLDLGRCRNITDDGLALLAIASRISSLHLHNCAGITDRGIRALSRLPNLGTLDISGCQVGDEGICSLTNPSLRVLNVLNCTGVVSDASLRHISASLKSLTSLLIPIASVRSADSVSLLSALMCLNQLEVSRFDAELLRGISGCSSLRALTISDMTGSAPFASLSTLELESLHLLRCPDLEADDLMSGLVKCDRLFHLCLLDSPHLSASLIAPLSTRALALQDVSISSHGDSPTAALSVLQAHFTTAALTVYVDGAEA